MILAILLGCGGAAPGPRPAPADLDPPLRVAVALGHDPDDRAADLAEAGAERFGDALRERGWRAEVLTGDGASAEALRAAVLGLSAVPGHAPHDDDRLLVYVSAHGERARDARGDAAPALRLSAGSATVASLIELVDAIPIQHKALVLDACFPGLPEGARRAGLSPRQTLVLTAAGDDESAGAATGQGGLYTRCLLDGFGAGSLLGAQLQAGACVSGARPDQRPRVYPPSAPVFDVPLANAAPSASLLLDGLSPTLPEGMHMEVDGQDPTASGGLIPRLGEHHRLDLFEGEHRVASVERDWPAGLLGLAARPDAAQAGADWIRLLPEARHQTPEFQEVADASGLSALVQGGYPSGVVAVSLDGVHPGWFITRREAPPVYAINVAPVGQPPRYEAGLDLSAAPAEFGTGTPPALLDLDQDGAPEVCYVQHSRRLVCVARAGLFMLPELEALRVDQPPIQADLDGDADLDLLLRSGPVGGEWRWEVWGWQDGRYARVDVLAGSEDAQTATVLDLDADARPDLLLDSQWGGGAARFYGIPGQGRPWATALSAELLGLGRAPTGLWRVALDGAWALAVTDREQMNLYPVGALQLGPARAGPGPEPGARGSVAVLGADLDLDGATDLIRVHRDVDQPPHRLYLRRASQGGWLRLRDVPGLNLSTDDQGVALDDIDRDGDLDLLALNGDELSVPPDGCCRLFLSDASARARRLIVDVAQDGLSLVGAELRLLGGQPELVALDGGRRAGAAIFGLGAGGVPGGLEVRWPDGRAETVHDGFVAEPGGWRVQIGRASSPGARLLVGAWVVDLAAPPERRVSLADGLRLVRRGDVAWRTPAGLAVYADGPGQIVLLDAAGRAIGAPVPAAGCGWGGWIGGPLGRLALGCSDTSGGAYTERMRLWAPGDGRISASLAGAPTYSRTLALDGDRVWISARRREITAHAATPTLPALGLSLPAPEGAVDRTFLHVTDQREILVFDQGAERVEVWSDEPPALARLIPTGPFSGAPTWDEGRGAWLIPVTDGVVAVSPSQGVTSRWDSPAPVARALPLDGGAIALLVQSSPPEVRVYDATGGPARLVVTMPRIKGGVFARLE